MIFTFPQLHLDDKVLQNALDCLEAGALSAIRVSEKGGRESYSKDFSLFSLFLCSHCSCPGWV